jgi:hypothetical protein
VFQTLLILDEVSRLIETNLAHFFVVRFVGWMCSRNGFLVVVVAASVAICPFSWGTSLRCLKLELGQPKNKASHGVQVSLLKPLLSLVYFDSAI